MAEQQPMTTEDRLKALEAKYEELQRRLDSREAMQTMLDSAFLAKLDETIASIGRVEGGQVTIFRQTMVELRAHTLRLKAIEANQEKLPQILADHKVGIERNNQEISTIDAKIDQVLSLLLDGKGKPRND